ncbi:MAG TPA: CidA/LrgA family protein [Nocardioidaceae bacterium]
MVIGLIALLACQLVGELVVRTLGVPLPGPLLGMVLMFALLLFLRPRSRSGLVRAPMTLLRHLPLLYIPAGVGVVAYLTVLRASLLPAAAALALSWLAGLLVTAGTVALLLRLTGARRIAR